MYECMYVCVYVCRYGRGFDSGGLEDSINCADMEKGGRCSRSRLVQKYCTPKSCHLAAVEDSGWESRESAEINIDEEQQGLRKGRWSMDGMFTLKQLVEKRLKMQWDF